MPHAHDPAPAHGSAQPSAHAHAPGTHGSGHTGHGHGAHRDHGTQGGAHPDDHGGHGGGHGPAGIAHQEILDLDAEVAAGPTADLIARAAALTDGPVRHVIDVGAGTGTGTFALLRHFAEATATALDSSGEMLHHLTKSAARHGLADRIHPLRADLDEGWPATTPADLVWASSSLHHMAHPDRVLREIHTALRPGGVLVVLEMEHLPRFLPHDLGPGLGEPGLEARLHAAAERARDEHLPHMGADWPALLTAAGFTVREAGTLDVTLPAPLPPQALRYARATLERFSAGMADRLPAADRTALATLLAATGPAALEHRPDVTLTSSRHTWLATA